MAITYQYYYQNEQQLKEYLSKNELYDLPNLMVEVLTDSPDSEKAAGIQAALRGLLPESRVLTGLKDNPSPAEGTKSEIKLRFTILDCNEDAYRLLFIHTSDLVFSADCNGRITSVNPAFTQVFGLEEAEAAGLPAFQFIIKEQQSRWSRRFQLALKGKPRSGKVSAETAEGKLIEMNLTLYPLIIGGRMAGVIGMARNRTEHRQLKEKLEQISSFDTITGLPNRGKFTEILEQRVEQEAGRRLAVMFIDLDRFKLINDSLGHQSGDMILKLLADRIREAAPTGTYLGRFAGDKFTLMLTREDTVKDISWAARSIMDALTKAVRYDEKDFFITASIGISLYPSDAEDTKTLLRCADTAMNHSKNLGGNRITLFSKEMQKQAQKRLEMESSLRRAIRNNEFYLCYQPLAHIKDKQIYGSEALIRWNHPELGIIPPGEFIPLAEEIGLIEDIGTWVLQTACLQNKKWQDSGLDGLVISVNVSATQFQQPHFINHVHQALSESGLDPEFLHLELTESMMIGNIDYSVSVMKTLQEMGVKVSIDDFGTGYSSLSYLKNLPIDTLKIDRSFIHNLRDTSDIAIVKAIITMGRGLDVKVIAEGVETREQLELLQEMECHYAQGFYIHRPLTIAQFEEDVKAQAMSALI